MGRFLHLTNNLVNSKSLLYSKKKKKKKGKMKEIGYMRLEGNETSKRENKELIRGNSPADCLQTLSASLVLLDIQIASQHCRFGTCQTINSCESIFIINLLM